MWSGARVFSAAGKMHDDLRKSEKDSTLEHSLFAACGVMVAWWQRGGQGLAGGLTADICTKPVSERLSEGSNLLTGS